VIEGMERRKDSMISALWSNDGFNDDKGSRQNAIQEIEESFQAAISQVRGGMSEDEEQIDPDNPFFSNTMRQMKKLDEQMSSSGTVQQRIEQEADFSRYVDQS
jgi:hypothetical protein